MVNLLLIDTSVKNYQFMVDSVNDVTIPIIYSSNSPKTEILFAIQNKFTKIDRIGMVFERNARDYNFLDNQPLFLVNETSPFSENLQFIIDIITFFDVQNIDYLACNTLQFPNWRNYYAIIQNNTNAIVGASNDSTGNIQYGGDWLMESTNTDIELLYFSKSIEYYQYLLGGGYSGGHALS